MRAKWPVLLKALVSSRRTGLCRSGALLLLLFWHFFGINFCAQAADLVRVGSLACTRNARSRHFHQKNTYRKWYFFASQNRACAAVFVDVAVVTLRPFKSFQLFSTVVFRNFFVSFSLFWRVGASSLCARCGFRRYRLRHSATLYLLSQISCDSYTVERPRWSGAWIENGREKY